MRQCNVTLSPLTLLSLIMLNQRSLALSITVRVKTFIGDQLNNGKKLPELFIVFMQQFQASNHMIL